MHVYINVIFTTINICMYVHISLWLHFGSISADTKTTYNFNYIYNNNNKHFGFVVPLIIPVHIYICTYI